MFRERFDGEKREKGRVSYCLRMEEREKVDSHVWKEEREKERRTE